MSLAEKVYPKIPFRKKTIPELLGEGFSAADFELDATNVRAYCKDPFPSIIAQGKVYRTILVLHGVASLPKLADFTTKPNPKSKGALIVNCIHRSTSASDLYFNIYIESHYCACPAKNLEEFERLFKRAETFAMEFLAATIAYDELAKELPSDFTGKVVPERHAEYDEAFRLICPDLEIIQSALKFYSPTANAPTLADFVKHFGDDLGATDGVKIPDFWDYCREVLRARPPEVGKRLRLIYLEFTGVRSDLVRRAMCSNAKICFEKHFARAA